MNGVDTNVLVRYLVQDDPSQAKTSARFVRSGCTPEEPCVVNRIVLCELVWVLERAYGYSRERIAEVLERMFKTVQFRIENLPTSWSALRLYRDSQADFADCLLGEINRRTLGCEVTVTFDKKAGQLDGFKLLT